MTKPLDDMPFDALISVRYRVQGRLGQWIDKEAKSTMFPLNWNITRVKQEIALVYDEMIKATVKFEFDNNIFRFLTSDGKFVIQVEVDQLGNITNAYPLFKYKKV
ncbi:EndoU domain-containing protein [Flavobacterium sp. HSC-61S13]|uniref:EndoU domain-containing protein n=1 Tax=Flavobacterium sp. HSC-61S13 TaxID=2910963 RepID=UPI0020A1DD59|nr:EndoU domain-containing protein [Flavobacterium sp. HSC-61S13]MCP1995289.1 hypothetical protein [Flavobacterium sp. HSC-61S13]